MADAAELEATQANRQYGPIPPEEALRSEHGLAPPLRSPSDAESSTGQRLLAAAALASVAGSLGLYVSYDLSAFERGGHVLTLTEEASAGSVQHLGSFALPSAIVHTEPANRHSPDTHAGSATEHHVPEWGHRKIQAGDTFWGLEQAHGWPHGILHKLNPHLDPRTLAVGQTVRTLGEGLLSRHFAGFGAWFKAHGGTAWVNGGEPDHVQKGDGVLVRTKEGLTSGKVTATAQNGAHAKLTIDTESHGTISREANPKNVPVVGSLDRPVPLGALHGAVDKPSAETHAVETTHHTRAHNPPATARPGPSTSAMAAVKGSAPQTETPNDAAPAIAEFDAPTGPAQVSTEPAATSSPSTAPKLHTHETIGDQTLPSEISPVANIPGMGLSPTDAVSAPPASPGITHAPKQAGHSLTARSHRLTSPESQSVSAEQQRLLHVSAKDVGHVGITPGAWAADPHDDGSWCAKQVMAWFAEAGIPLNLGNNFGPRVAPTAAGGSLLEAMQQNYQYHPNTDTSFTPTVGDIVFFEWSPSEWHTGMVVGVTPNHTLITREGASRGSDTGQALGVNENHWTNFRANSEIVGFARVLSAHQQSGSGNPGAHHSQQPPAPGSWYPLPPGAKVVAEAGGAGTASPAPTTSSSPGDEYFTPAGYSSNGPPADWWSDNQQPAPKAHGAPTTPPHAYGPDTHYTMESLVTVKSGLTINELNTILAGTPLAGYGAVFHHLEAEDDVNALFAIAHAQLESGHETSDIALAKHNIYGIRAYDTNTYKNASTFASYQQCIQAYGQLLATKYLHPGDEFYGGGATIKDIFVHYSTSHVQEPKSIVKIMLELLMKLKTPQ